MFMGAAGFSKKGLAAGFKGFTDFAYCTMGCKARAIGTSKDTRRRLFCCYRDSCCRVPMVRVA